MTIFQNGSNIQVAVRRETTLGVPPGTGGGTIVRVLQSPGLQRKRVQIQSNEKRTDMLRSMPRLGGVTVDGSYNAELTVGGATDIFIEAMMRSTWQAAMNKLSSSYTTLTFGVSTITAAAGSFLTDGWKVGDILFATGTAVAANNGVNTRIVSVTANVITVGGTPFSAGGADATGSITRLKKVVNGATPTRYSHTIEQYNVDIDQSEQFLGCRIVGMKLSFKPGQMGTATFTFAGLDRAILSSAASPYYIAPTLTTGLDLVADDSIIRYNGADVTNFNGFDLDFTLANKTEPVIGSPISPDVFDNDLTVSGSITALRSDFSGLTQFDAETEFDVQVLLQEPNGTPRPALSLYLSRAKIGALSAPILGDGGLTETRSLLVGPKVADTSHDAGYCSFSSSAP